MVRKLVLTTAIQSDATQCFHWSLLRIIFKHFTIIEEDTIITSESGINDIDKAIIQINHKARTAKVGVARIWRWKIARVYEALIFLIVLKDAEISIGERAFHSTTIRLKHWWHDLDVQGIFWCLLLFLMMST